MASRPEPPACAFCLWDLVCCFLSRLLRSVDAKSSCCSAAQQQQPRPWLPCPALPNQPPILWRSHLPCRPARPAACLQPLLPWQGAQQRAVLPPWPCTWSARPVRALFDDGRRRLLTDSSCGAAAWGLDHRDGKKTQLVIKNSCTSSMLHAAERVIKTVSSLYIVTRA